MDAPGVRASRVAGEPPPALLVRTRRSTTQPALLRLPSASPTNRPLTGPRAQEPSENRGTSANESMNQARKGEEVAHHREIANQEEESEPRVRSALYSAGLRPSQRGAPPVAPPRSRLHLPSRRFDKPLERGRALTPTASRRASTNRERAAPPLPFTPSAGKIQAEEFRREKSTHHRDPSCFPPRVLGRFPTRKPS